MKGAERLGLALGIMRESIEIRILFSMDQARFAAMLINCELAHHRAQPTTERTCS